MQDRSQENPQKSPTNQVHSPEDGAPSLHSKTFPSTISPIALLLRQAILEDTANRTHDTQLQSLRTTIVSQISAEIESTPITRLDFFALSKKYASALQGAGETFIQAIRSVSTDDPEKNNRLIQYRLQVDNRFALSVFSLLDTPLASLSQGQSGFVEQIAALSGRQLARFLDRVFLEPLDINVTHPLLENVVSVISPKILLKAAKMLMHKYSDERTNQRSELLNLFRVYAAFDPAEGDTFHDIARVVYVTTSARSCRSLVVDLATFRGVDFSDLYLAVARNQHYSFEKRESALRHWIASVNDANPETLNTLETFLSDPMPLMVREAVRMLITSPVGKNLGDEILNEHVISSLDSRRSSLALCSLISIISPEGLTIQPRPPVHEAVRNLKAILGSRLLSDAEIEAVIKAPGVTFKEESSSRDTKFSHLSEQLASSLPIELVLELLTEDSIVSANTDAILRAMPAKTQKTFEGLVRRYVAAVSAERRPTLYHAAKLEHPRDGEHGT